MAPTVSELRRVAKVDAHSYFTGGLAAQSDL
jgi:hypothetical protein